MKNIIAFAGSNSRESINKKLAIYAASLVEDAKITILDLNDFELPLFGVDIEKQFGPPDNVRKFLDYIKNSDGIILSLAEHNGAYSTAFKNLFDWMSRSETKTFMGKPMLLMATSSGVRGGASVLAMAHSRFPRHDAKIAAEFSLPFFSDKFANGKITDLEFDVELKEAVQLFQKQL